MCFREYCSVVTVKLRICCTVLVFGSKCSISSRFDGGFSFDEVRVHSEAAEVS